MNKSKTLLTLIFIAFFTTFSFAEKREPISATDTIASKDVDYTQDIFLSSRVINGHSTEGTTQGRLDFRIEHRFDVIKNGYSEFYGLDHAYTFLGLEYGIKDWIMVGINRTSLTQTVSGFTKIRLLRQVNDDIHHPVSVSFLIGTGYMGQSLDNSVNPADFWGQLNYMSQILIARKFNSNFSAQVSPIFIHRNKIVSITNNNNLVALGLSARCSISPTLSLSGEYYPVLNPSEYYKSNNFNSLSFSFDIQTPGHVFQIVLTNSSDMIEKNFIGETTGNWLKGDIHLGFNILRKFYL